MKKSILFLLLLLAFGAFADGEAINLTRVQQRYPWNGKIDFDYTVSGIPEGSATNYFVRFKVTVTNDNVGTEYTPTNIVATNVVFQMDNDTYRATWDTQADGVLVFSTNVHAVAELVRADGDFSGCPYLSDLVEYLVIDLSNYQSESDPRFTVTKEYRAEGDFDHYNTDEYKGDKLVLRRIKAGTFTMGSSTGTIPFTSGTMLSASQHQVTLTQDFYIGLFPVTTYQYWRVAGGDQWAYYKAEAPLLYTGLRGSADGTNTSKLASRTVDSDSWFGKLRTKTGNHYKFDLPTDAQFEYAARAGKTGWFVCDLPDDVAAPTSTGSDITAYGWGWGDCTGQALAALTDHMWMKENKPDSDPEVGTKLPNAWGLYDMAGTPHQFCLDLLSSADGVSGGASWGTSAVTDPLWQTGSDCIIYRCGWWKDGDWRRNQVAARCTLAIGDNDWSKTGFRISATIFE